MSENKHVLLVDDEEEIVNFMGNFLRRFKISSEKALSGEDALNVYEKGKFDYVFLDINMRNIDGLAVLSELKKRDPDVRVIIITGSADSSSREKALELGAIDYISKPLDLGDLKDKIEKYIMCDVEG